MSPSFKNKSFLIYILHLKCKPDPPFSKSEPREEQELPQPFSWLTGFEVLRHRNTGQVLTTHHPIGSKEAPPRTAMVIEHPENSRKDSPGHISSLGSLSVPPPTINAAEAWSQHKLRSTRLQRKTLGSSPQ